MRSRSVVPRSTSAAVPGFLTNTRASVGIVFALAAVPILFGFGMGLDYAAAARKRERLNAVADAAALAATTPNMMQQTALQAKLAATSMFLAQAGQIGGVTGTSVTINVNDNSTNGTTVRTVSVSYTTASLNQFSKLLKMNTIGLSGNSAASTSIPPNTNFYVLLDSSPSMAIAATQDGINTMVNNTKSQDGCAFACHQTNPKDDNLGNPNGEDNYALARALGVTLRIDLVNQAAQNLMTYLNAQAQTYDVKYGAATYSFDYQINTLGPMTDLKTGLQAAKTYASNLQMLTMYKNGWRTSSDNGSNNDQDTDWDSAMTALNSGSSSVSKMQTPGTGTNNLGDTPQEVLLIVTDGVMDEANGGRKIAAMGGSICTTIKNRGIRIAILYTTYKPLPTNSFYNNHVAPFQNNIGPTLQACASTGLYSVVDTGGDISTALQTLTSKALKSSHLTQ